MKNRARICFRMTFLPLIVYWLAGAECVLAGNGPKIDKASVRNIEVVLDSDNLDQFDAEADKNSLAARIAKNLADADFPINKPAEKIFTHTLKARLSRIEFQSTPSGFSFSIGDSDPRGQDFQKANVLTVECTLSAKRDNRTVAQEATEFSANALKAERNRSKIADTLTDYISSACFDLLEDLNLEAAADPQSPGDGTVKRPRWIPNIRIEVKNVAPPAANKSGAATEKAAEPKPEQADQEEQEGRKEMIIHNQGTPVILKFGHDR